MVGGGETRRAARPILVTRRGFDALTDADAYSLVPPRFPLEDARGDCCKATGGVVGGGGGLGA